MKTDSVSAHRDRESTKADLVRHSSPEMNARRLALNLYKLRDNDRRLRLAATSNASGELSCPGVIIIIPCRECTRERLAISKSPS